MTPLRLALIVAVAENGVIGIRGGLPWRVKADLKLFRAITMGKPLIMGRKTHASIGRVLDGRDNIVVTRRPDACAAGALPVAGMTQAIGLAGELAIRRGADEICVIGGGEVYRQALPLADRLYVTHVKASPDGDVFFDASCDRDWRVMRREALAFSDGDSAPAEQAVYDRI